MSSLVSGIGKIFTSIGSSGLATTLGNAVRGVGASLFTAGAATGSSLGGGLSKLLGGGGGVLSNMINGAASILGGGVGNLARTVQGAAGAVGATSATGLGAAAGAGPWGASLADQVLGPGVFPAATPTGFAPAGASASTQAGGGLLGALGISDDTLNAGLAGFGDWAKTEQEKEALLETQGQLIDEKKRSEAQLRANYEVPASAYAGGSGYVPDPVPRVTPKKMWAYDKADGTVKQMAA